jgi:DNA-directed RNA polymerase subunit beta'
MAFNADFDGDQMAVHVPLSVESQAEARVLMMSTNNILSPANGGPVIIPTQDIVLGLYYMTRERRFAKGEGKCFSSTEEARIAYDQGAVELHAKVKIRINGDLVETTIGRMLLSELLPARVPYSVINKVMTKKQLAWLIDYTYRNAGTKDTVILADRLKDLGYEYATRAGISVCVNDMMIPVNKEEILSKAENEVLDVEKQYTDGLITVGEKYNKVIDVWSKATEAVAKEMMDEMSVEYLNANKCKKCGLEYSQDMKNCPNPECQNDKKARVSLEIPSFNPIFIMADSGARGSKDQIRQLAGMRGLMAKPSGAIIESPIKANFREGLGVLEYFISTHGARKGLADTALKTANSGYLTRRLVDVAQDSTIIENDCDTLDGIWAEPLMEGGEIIQRVGERILGRVSLDDIYDPFTDELLVGANQQITEEKVEAIEAAGIDRVLIRSVLTCRSKRGVCAQCYGRDLGRGHMVNIGEAIGIIAAQSIGEPGTQLTMRTFHIGGTASRRAEQAEIRTQHGGTVRFQDIHHVRNAQGRKVVMNRNGEVCITGPEGRDRERYPVNYGAQLLVEDGEQVKPGDILADWDPYTIPIVCEVGGVVKYGDVVEGTTMQERVDPVTGKASKVIIQSRLSGDMNPRITIKDKKNKTLKLPDTGSPARYSMPVGSIISVNEGDTIEPGTVVGKIPRETTKTKDITGGLPRVAELFEVRKPKEHAVITEIDGRISFGKDLKGKRRVVVTPEFGESKEYLIPKAKHVSVHEGDYVKAGEPLMDGSPIPNDILRVLGVKELARFLVNEIQEVYRLQGVKINDKHIEVIVRQMLRRVQITDPGDSSFMLGEQVEWWIFEEENERIIQAGNQPAVAEPLLLGVTKASLSTGSFISAASFQETTKVLTNAAMGGRIDRLLGLKENVIMGRLVPAGTGLEKYRFESE